MATVPLFQVDAFATRVFEGNPAAVMPLPAFPPDDVLQALALENNLSETAFLVRDGVDYQLRWFTPAAEVPLCGHATLASAAVVLERLEPGRPDVVFHTLSGPLTVRRDGDGYLMDFPARPAAPVAAPAGFADMLGSSPVEVQATDVHYLAVFDAADTVRLMRPDMVRLAGLDRAAVIVTAPGEDGFDCLSRYFAPAKGIPEDPVTGSAHCTLAPYWAARLGRSTLRAFQASARGGRLTCTAHGDRVALQGTCVFFLEGAAAVPLP